MRRSCLFIHVNKFILWSLLILLPACTHKHIPWFKTLPTHRYNQEQQKPMVIVIPSYNNQGWYKYNLDSVYAQKYQNFSIIYIDDCSTDNTAPLVTTYIKKHKYTNIKLIKNKKRHGALANIWHALALCQDNVIVITLDGDDWLSHNQVLAYLNHYYQNPTVWLTYGQFQNWPTGSAGWCQDIPQEVIVHNNFRANGFWFAQLRTFYAWLAKKINQHDLIDPQTGDFYQVAGDAALMFPMVELAGTHIRYIDQVLYFHNVNTPLNDFKVHHNEQMAVTAYIQKQRAYFPLAP